MQKILFLDRDGTLILEPEDYQVDSLDKVEFYPQMFFYLSKIVKELDYELVMVTNQDGLGTEEYPEDTFWPAHNMVLRALENEDIHFREILIDRTFKHENALTRKPNTGMVLHYLNDEEIDIANSYVVGDRITDMQLAANMGAQGIWLNNDPDLGGDEISEDSDTLAKTISLTTTSWQDLYHFLKSKGRRASIQRTTKETNILVHLNLDGQGQYNNHTGIGFFDHMLDQLAKHSGCDLSVEVEGDLHIDEHHTIEDTALALGQAFREALGDKRGIERYGSYLLPMDESLAQVALDFGGRPWLVWSDQFRREKVGQFPMEMTKHFFKSFSDQAQCNINAQVSGDNDHHQIEALFKAFARAIKMAISFTGGNDLPSTKGVL
ncbi:MAG: bifunctional histidinol-phosphatase/imidazoleglycerol-phosphate dehydratase HisB [Saprospiraceae bacterium]